MDAREPWEHIVEVDATRRNTTIRANIVFEDEASHPMIFANAVMAKLTEPAAMTVVVTFGQYSAPDLSGYTPETIPDDPIEIPAQIVGRVVLTVEKYREWIDSTIANYRLLFQADPPLPKDEGQE